MKVIRTNSNDLNFQQLVKKLDENLEGYYKEEQSFYDELNEIEKIEQVVVVYNEQEKAVGCGGFKQFSNNEAEIKRMFVSEESRGKGIATIVLKELEKWSSELKFEKCILETLKQKEYAIKFYQKHHYKVIPNYGAYSKAQNSVCFAKKLVS